MRHWPRMCTDVCLSTATISLRNHYYSTNNGCHDLQSAQPYTERNTLLACAGGAAAVLSYAACRTAMPSCGGCLPASTRAHTTANAGGGEGGHAPETKNGHKLVWHVSRRRCAGAHYRSRSKRKNATPKTWQRVLPLLLVGPSANAVAETCSVVHHHTHHSASLHDITLHCTGRFVVVTAHARHVRHSLAVSPTTCCWRRQRLAAYMLIRPC